ncbi:unnamed protein product [Ectocarpus sp. 8 AP-2014]
MTEQCACADEVRDSTLQSGILLRLGGMVWQVTIIAVSLVLLAVVYAAIASMISEQNTSGNVGIRSGEVCNPGDVGYDPGDMDEALFYAFECILDILVLVVILRTLWFVALLLGGTATTLLARAM